MCLGEIDAVGVFFLVSVADNIALVVVALADKPTEDSGRVRRIDNPTFQGFPVPRCNVVSGDGLPERFCRISLIGPTLDAGEQSFDARTEPLDAICFSVYLDNVGAICSRSQLPAPAPIRTGTKSSAPERMKTSDSSASWYLGNPLSVLRVIDGRERDQPNPNGPLPIPNRRKVKVVGRSRSDRTNGDRHRHGAGAGDRIGGKLPPMPRIAPSPFGSEIIGGERSALRRIRSWSPATFAEGASSRPSELKIIQAATVAKCNEQLLTLTP